VLDIDRDLNPAQREAVLVPGGPLLILAGAGSGKTRVITYRLAHLLNSGTDPRAIIAVTFTNKAAGEMRERAERLAAGARGGWIGTFHALAARLVRTYADRLGLRRDFVIFDDHDQRTLTTRLLKDLNLSERLFPPRQLLAQVDDAKNRGEGPADVAARDWQGETFKRFYTAYQQRLLRVNACDFGDLLLHALRLCQAGDEVSALLARRFEHVLVDEFQDTNRVQYLLAQHFARGCRNLCVVGDDDQSIYRWRGADLRNILDFERDYPDARVVKLERNYRSTRVILQAANGVIARNRARKAKTLYTENETGMPILYAVCEDERAEAQFISRGIRHLQREEGRPPGDCAVFYRTHAQSRVIEEALRAADLHYAIVGGLRFYDRAEIKDLCGYLRVIHNPDDEVDLLRIVNVPARGLGETSVEKIVAFARARGLSLADAMRECTPPGSEVVGTAARRRLLQFVELLDRLRAASASLGPADLADLVLEETGYLAALAADNTDESQSRVENLMEFIGDVRQYEQTDPEPSLTGYLERISLASDLDKYDAAEGRVSLMTIHSAKGLEFKVVFVAGLEEGIFPHGRSLDDLAELEEERRLAYVAITRARERLLLLRARQRTLYGQPQQNPPSRFIADIPAECVAVPRGYEPEAPLTFGGRGGGRDDEAAPAFIADEETQRLTRAGRLAAAARLFVEDEASGPHPPPRREGSNTAALVRRHDRGDSVIEYDDDHPGYRIGMRVRHQQFGEGEVRGWTGQGEGLKLQIFFPRAGLKTIVARFVSVETAD
jgi:DNA helicase II / ATP-dependent DNA helicase PcrA